MHQTIKYLLSLPPHGRLGWLDWPYIVLSFSNTQFILLLNQNAPALHVLAAPLNCSLVRLLVRMHHEVHALQGLKKR